MKLHVLIFLLVAISSVIVPLNAQNAEPVPLRARWSPTGERVAVTDGQNLVIYDEALVEQRRIALFNPDDDVYASSVSVEWSPKGDKIAVYSSGETFRGYRIWDVATSERLGEIAIATWSQMLWWLPDNTRLAVHQGDIGEIFVYQTDGTQVDTWTFPIETPDYRTDDPNDTVIWNKDILDMAWTPNGQFLVTSTIYDFPIDVWEGRTQKHLADIYCGTCLSDLRIVLSPKGHMVLFGATDNITLEVQEINPVRFVDSFLIPENFHPNRFTNLFFGWRDNSHVWHVASDGFLYLQRLRVVEPRGKFAVDLDQLQDVSLDGTNALYGEGQTLGVIEIETGDLLARTTIETDATFISRYWEPDPRG